MCIKNADLHDISVLKIYELSDFGQPVGKRLSQDDDHEDTWLGIHLGCIICFVFTWKSSMVVMLNNRHKTFPGGYSVYCNVFHRLRNLSPSFFSTNTLM